jgi:hypothetical protein
MSRSTTQAFDSLQPPSISDMGRDTGHTQALAVQSWQDMPRPSGHAERAEAPRVIDFGAHSDIYPARQTPPLKAEQIRPALDHASSVNFTTAASDRKNHVVPDFIMGEDGKLRANPDKKTPNKDGSVNIEVQSKHKQEVDSKKAADQLQKAAIKDLIAYMKKNNPEAKIPEDWQNTLANEPDLPPAPVPLTPELTPTIPDTPVQQPTDSGRGGGGGVGGDGGGGGGGGGFAGQGGFDNSGYFKGNGSEGEGSLYTGGSDSKGEPLGPGEKVQAKEIYDYLTDKYDMTPAQASGVLGNMQVESGFKTDAYNKGEGAIGLCQWEGGRRTNLENFAAAEGKPVTDWHVQVDFMMHEMKGSEHGAYDQLKQANTPQEAAAAFDKYYERSSGEARGTRMANAQNIYNDVANA